MRRMFSSWLVWLIPLLGVGWVGLGVCVYYALHIDLLDLI